MTDESAGKPEQKPSIIIDDDWKAQAQAEKQRLSEQERQKRAESEAHAGGEEAGGSGEGRGRGELPPANFETLLGTMISNVIMYLGGVADPQTGRPVVAPDHARFYIDLLGVLEEKTKGNLSEEVASALRRAISELRLEFLEVMKAIERASMQQGGGGMAGGGDVFGMGGGAGMPPSSM